MLFSLLQVLDLVNDVLLLIFIRGNFILLGSKPQSDGRACPPHCPLASQLKLLADRQMDGGFTTFPVLLNEVSSRDTSILSRLLALLFIFKLYPLVSHILSSLHWTPLCTGFSS